jgi:alkanesulfonate monooxygenase SsuD/methylene tetrahydromethanopterin reductase-like flavin-dependent oxidoreductase (luciferase family)
VIAGNGPRGMRLALAHGDGWATMGTAPHGSDPEAWWKGVAEAATRFDELAANVDFPRPGIRRYLDHMALAGPVGSVEKLHDDAGRAAALGFTDVVMPWPRVGDPFAGSMDVIERFADRLVDGSLAT